MDKSFGEIKIPLDFATGHLSMTYHEWNWGECPHRLYKVTISLENCRSEGIAINQKNGDGSLTELGKTDESGTLVVYLKEGEYSLTATDVNKTYSKTFTVNQDAVDLAGHALTIELPLTSSVIVNPSNPIASGTCGTNLTWSLDGLGTLIISGTGSMTDFTSSYDDDAGTLTIRGTGEITDTPWSDPMILPYSVHIKNVVLEDGITGICSYAFDYTDIVSVTLPATLTHIDYSAFDGCSDLTTVNYAGSPEQWNNIKIANHNDELLNATRHYYSSNASTVSSEENSIFPSTATGNDHSFAASFSDLTPGVSYAVIVSRSEIDPLAPENLIYINQFRATSSGYQQSFQTPRSSALNADDMTYVIASGIYSFDEAPTPTPTPGGGSSSGGGGGGGGGAAVLIGVGAAAAITAGVIMMSPVEIKGRVVLADQAAVPGAKISLLREGKVVAQTTADENGSFSLKAKRGSYELTAAYTTADGQLIYKIIDIKAPAKDLTVTF